MRTFLLSTIILLLNLVNGFAQDHPIFQFTTELEPGTKVSLMLRCQTVETVLVDFATGETEEMEVGVGITSQYFTVGDTKTVKIYGNVENILLISCPMECKITDIDISQLTELKYFFIHDNKADLVSIDVSHNPKLQELTITGAGLKEIDLTNNPLIGMLYLYNNNFTSLDKIKVVEENIIWVCYLGGNQLEELDLSVFPLVRIMDAGSNQLTKADVSKNYDLTNLYIGGNLLTSLDISTNGNLSYISCDNNYLTFSTLPSTEGRNIDGANYYYLPQKAIRLPEEAEQIDLSSEYEVFDAITTYTWYTESGVQLVENEDYTFSNGITTFLKEQEEKVYCELTNEVFPGVAEDHYALYTTLVTPKPENTDRIDSNLWSGNVYSNDRTIYIEGYEGSSASICTIEGKNSKEITWLSEKETINLSLSGMYIVKITKDHQVTSYKVFIK